MEWALGPSLSKVHVQNKTVNLSCASLPAEGVYLSILNLTEECAYLKYKLRPCVRPTSSGGSIVSQANTVLLREMEVFDAQKV